MNIQLTDGTVSLLTPDEAAQAFPELAEAIRASHPAQVVVVGPSRSHLTEIAVLCAVADMSIFTPRDPDDTAALLRLEEYACADLAARIERLNLLKDTRLDPPIAAEPFYHYHLKRKARGERPPRKIAAMRAKR